MFFFIMEVPGTSVIETECAGDIGVLLKKLFGLTHITYFSQYLKMVLLTGMGRTFASLEVGDILASKQWHFILIVIPAALLRLGASLN